MTGPNGQADPKRSEGWRAWLGNLLVALAGGLGVNLISSDVGYRGAAISAATGGILLGAVRLRRFPEEAPLVVASSWAMLITGTGCTILAAFTPSPLSGYAVLAAVLFALGAAVIPLDRYRAVRTLGGTACIGIGISLIGEIAGFLDDRMVVTVHALIDSGSTNPFAAGAVAVIGIGISMTGAGITLLLHRTKWLGVAGVSLGGSLIGAGIVLVTVNYALALGAWLIAAGVIAVIGAGIAFPLVRPTLLRVASIGLGVSLISAGVVLLLPSVQTSVAWISLGASLISAGITVASTGVPVPPALSMVPAIGRIGFGVSLISAGIAIQFLGWTALAAWLIAPGIVAIATGAALLVTHGRVAAIARVSVAMSLIGAGVAALLLQDTMLWILPMLIDPRVAVALSTGVAIGAWLAIGSGFTSLAAGVALPLARETLTGIAGICFGLSLIGSGIAAAALIGAALFAVWLIGAGISLIALAVARLRDQNVLGSAATIGFGISLTVLSADLFLDSERLGGVAAIGASIAALAAGVAFYPQAELRKWLSGRWAEWTQVPDR